MNIERRSGARIRCSDLVRKNCFAMDCREAQANENNYLTCVSPLNQRQPEAMAGNGKATSPVDNQRRSNGTFAPGNSKGFHRGQSGNPKGRPKRSEAFGQTIRTWLEQKDKKAGKPRILALIDRLYVDDPKTLLAYGFGKPVEMIELTGAEGGAVDFVIKLQQDRAELP